MFEGGPNKCMSASSNDTASCEITSDFSRLKLLWQWIYNNTTSTLYKYQSSKIPFCKIEHQPLHVHMRTLFGYIKTLSK